MISIVIPVYNRAALIQRAIESIQLQTFSEWECIIVDDFSTDRLKETIQLLSLQDPRIKYVLNQRSKGAQGARNTGILTANGPWVAFLDSDDQWLAHKLEVQWKALQENNFDPYTMVHGDCLLKNESDDATIEWNLPLVEGMRPFKQLLTAPSPVFPAILTSKKAIIDAGLLDEKALSYQEWDAALRLARFCHFIHLRQPLFIYHQHGGETISKDGKRNISGYHYIIRSYSKDIRHYYGKLYLASISINNIKKAVDIQDWKLAKKMLNEARMHLTLKTYAYYMLCFLARRNPDNFLNLQVNL